MSPKEAGASAVEPQEKAARSERAQKREAKKAATGGLTPTWWVPTALTLMVLGLVWVMTYYISSGSYPIPGIDLVNIVIGFVFIMAGFVMLTRWK